MPRPTTTSRLPRALFLSQTAIAMLGVALGVVGCTTGASTAATGQPAGTPAAVGQSAPGLLPWPRTLTAGDGELRLPAGARIVATNPSLMPAAELLADELWRTTGQRFAVAAGPAKAGDVALNLDPTLPADTYALAVTDRVTVRADQYRSATWGVAAAVQLAEAGADGGSVAVPRVTVEDRSHFAFPGLMVDVGRNRISLDTLKQVVVLCHYYKIPYLQLHLTDDQGFTFPSKAFPQAGSQNHAMRGPKVEVYPIDGLRDLVAYADARGVTIIPELELPGHSGALQRSVPDPFGYTDPATGKPQSLSVINLTNEAIYPAIDTLMGELADVFKSSPFIHIGCDEVFFGELEKRPETKAYLEKNGLTNVRQLYPRFINRVNAIVKKHGRQTIVWEAFRPDEKVDKDITVLAWDGWNFKANELVKAGYRTVHVPWTPSIYSTSRELYNEWDPYNPHGNRLEKDAPLFGAMMVYWEQTDERTMPMLRMKTPIRQERIWNTNAGRSFEDMAARFNATDAKLDALLYGFKPTVSGLRNARETWVDVGVDKDGLNTGFTTSAEVSFRPVIEGTVRYTLDKSEPTTASPAYGQPIKLTDTTTVKARLFDAAGKPQGATWFSTYEYQPFDVMPTGVVAKDDLRFGKTATLTVPSAPAEGTVRYELNWNAGKAITAKSPAYEGPITIDKEQGVAFQYFDAADKPRGYRWEGRFEQVDFDPTNLTFHKPVTASDAAYELGPERAVDGVVQVKNFANTYWAAQPGPQWICVDLEKPVRLGQVTVHTYFDGSRFYHYTLELSPDGEKWTTVADYDPKNVPATAAGVTHAFAPTAARYIRVTMLKNSANPGLHVVEIRAAEAK